MVMSFDLATRQRELRSRSRRFAQEVLRDVKVTAERLPTPAERFAATRPAYEKLVADGFLRVCLPESVGGENQSLIDTAIVVEELYCENPSVALTLVGTVLGLQPILVGGSPEQQDRLLAPFVATAGAPLAAFCSSEPGGSANAASPPPGEGVRTRATRDGHDWIINGRKKWVSSATGWDGEGADVLCVVCRTDTDAPPDRAVSIIAVETPVEGIVLERVIDSPGYRAHLLPEFSFRNVVTPYDNLLGEEGGGLRLSTQSFASAAALVGMFGVALMRSAFDHALRFARTERRGGVVPVIEHQAVGYALADAKTSIEAARALSWRACCAVDVGHPAIQELANHAKIFGSETAVRVITDLMRIVGVDSYDNTDPLGGLLQDALALPIFAGGNMGGRRRALHAMLQQPDYDPLATGDGGRRTRRAARA
jgi:alkylation response protein AidB-like acyl-CoA dehydrogenase